MKPRINGYSIICCMKNLVEPPKFLLLICYFLTLEISFENTHKRMIEIVDIDTLTLPFCNIDIYPQIRLEHDSSSLILD